MKYGDKPGHLLLACGAGCDKSDVLAAIGLTMRDLFDSVTAKEIADDDAGHSNSSLPATELRIDN